MGRRGPKLGGGLKMRLPLPLDGQNMNLETVQVPNWCRTAVPVRRIAVLGECSVCNVLKRNLKLEIFNPPISDKVDPSVLGIKSQRWSC